jgi:hypothetical protein
MQELTYNLFGGGQEAAIALAGFPYADPLRIPTGNPQTPVLILGRPPPLSPCPNHLTPLPQGGLWSDADNGFSTIPLKGASPLTHRDRVARATPFPRMSGRVMALAHFLAAFKEAYLFKLCG